MGRSERCKLSDQAAVRSTIANYPQPAMVRAIPRACQQLRSLPPARTHAHGTELPTTCTMAMHDHEALVMRRGKYPTIASEVWTSRVSAARCITKYLERGRNYPPGAVLARCLPPVSAPNSYLGANAMASPSTKSRRMTVDSALPADAGQRRSCFVDSLRWRETQTLKKQGFGRKCSRGVRRITPRYKIAPGGPNAKTLFGKQSCSPRA